MNSVCEHRALSLVDIGERRKFNARRVAETVAHELGHIMGFDHSMNRSDCSCGIEDKKKCIMYGQNFRWEGKISKSFEDCFLTPDHLKLLQRKKCLQREMNSVRLYSTCGDGFADTNEDCDCGFEELCKNFKKIGECCNQKSCKFKHKDYQCSFGECCNNCKYESNKVCRTNTKEYDGVEYCSGDSHNCGHDRQKPDKHNGKDNMVFNLNYESIKKYCYDGNCIDLNDMCKLANINDGAYFSDECVELVNKIIRNTCPKIQNIKSPFKKFICKTPNLCCHFICALPFNKKAYGPFQFRAGIHNCIIAKKAERYGIKGNDPACMPSAGASDDNDSVCYFNHCNTLDKLEDWRKNQCNLTKANSKLDPLPEFDSENDPKQSIYFDNEKNLIENYFYGQIKLTTDQLILGFLTLAVLIIWAILSFNLRKI